MLHYGFCNCFHQLLDDDSMMTFKIVINLTIGKGQFRHNLLSFLGTRGVIFVDSLEFLYCYIYSAIHIIDPSIKISLILLCASPISNIQFPQVVHSPSTLFLYFSLPLISHPHDPSFLRRPCPFPLPGGYLHVCVSVLPFTLFLWGCGLYYAPLFLCFSSSTHL